MSDAETQDRSSAEEVTSSSTPLTSPGSAAASRWGVFAAVAIAVVAAVLAGLAYFHPADKGASAVAQQGGDAKANVCAAYAAAHKAVVINTHLQSPNPDLQLAIAANARLALIGGGTYLRDRLEANTAAPTDLKNAANDFSNTVQQLGINYLIDETPKTQNAVRKDLDTEIAKLDTLCPK